MAYEVISKNFSSNLNRVNFSISAFLLSACGSGGSVSKSSANMDIGYSSAYVPPVANFNSPNSTDPNFKVLEPHLNDPYWIKVLEMDEGENVINQILTKSDRLIKFSFPSSVPDYLPVTIAGWAPADENLVSSSRQIFGKLEEVLDISTIESENTDGFNNFVISKSIQSNSAGFSYFPNSHYQLGSDVFISKEYSNPLILSSGYTNYDYEILLHEIGHALGLKHPFEGDGKNLSILNSREDHTQFTAMSYNDHPFTFDGTFRSLDWMTLTKFYGVNPEFRSGDDIYTFSSSHGTFIIDGNGIDTISEPGSTADIFIDLRPGTHNYEGRKSSFITDANQLTISHGSEIENVYTGFGADIVIGNHLPNFIYSGYGDDIVFAGEGADIIYPGAGRDKVDLSEHVNEKDIIVIETIQQEEQCDIIYGFSQGATDDVVDLSELNLEGLIVLPMVDVSDVPSGYVDGCLVRVFGSGLSGSESVKAHFENSGKLENLKLSLGQKAVLITSFSQGTGETQNLYLIEDTLGSTQVHHLIQFVGNYLDIDNWSGENFLV